MISFSSSLVFAISDRSIFHISFHQFTEVPPRRLPPPSVSGDWRVTFKPPDKAFHRYSVANQQHSSGGPAGSGCKGTRTRTANNGRVDEQAKITIVITKPSDWGGDEGDIKITLGTFANPLRPFRGEGLLLLLLLLRVYKPTTPATNTLLIDFHLLSYSPSAPATFHLHPQTSVE